MPTDFIKHSELFSRRERLKMFVTALDQTRRECLETIAHSKSRKKFLLYLTLFWLLLYHGLGILFRRKF